MLHNQRVVFRVPFPTSFIAARYIKVPVPGKPKIVVQEEPYDVQMPPEAAFGTKTLTCHVLLGA